MVVNGVVGAPTKTAYLFPAAEVLLNLFPKILLQISTPPLMLALTNKAALPLLLFPNPTPFKNTVLCAKAMPASFATAAASKMIPAGFKLLKFSPVPFPITLPTKLFIILIPLAPVALFKNTLIPVV